MPQQMRGLPNQLTVLRLALIPVLWAAAGFGLTAVVAVGLTCAALTDALDGYLARRLGQVSSFGSRLDAVADTAMLISTASWTVMLRPEVIHDHPVLVTFATLLALGSLAVGWVRFRRVADLHLYSARAAAIAGYPFVVHTLLQKRDHYLEPLFYLTVALALVASIEALVIQLTRSTGDVSIGSVMRLGSSRGE